MFAKTPLTTVCWPRVLDAQPCTDARRKSPSLLLAGIASFISTAASGPFLHSRRCNVGALPFVCSSRRCRAKHTRAGVFVRLCLPVLCHEQQGRGCEWFSAGFHTAQCGAHLGVPLTRFTEAQQETPVAMASGGHNCLQNHSLFHSLKMVMWVASDSIPSPHHHPLGKRGWSFHHTAAEWEVAC